MNYKFLEFRIAQETSLHATIGITTRLSRLDHNLPNKFILFIQPGAHHINTSTDAATNAWSRGSCER